MTNGNFLLNYIIVLACFLILDCNTVDGLSCNGVTCPPYSFCDSLTRNCKCTEVATTKDPVCASDGKTYSDLQEMQKYSCEKNLTMYVLQMGACRYCKNETCPKHSYCSKDVDVCVCSPYREILSPVCGSDGKTYSNDGHLKWTACMQEMNISVQYSGSCKGPGVCGHDSCHRYSVCDPLTNKCSCNGVTNSTYYPVCGTDNSTYENEDILRTYSCLSNNSLDLQYVGKCKGDDVGTFSPTTSLTTYYPTVDTKPVRMKDEDLYYIVLPAVGGFVLLMVVVLTVVCCCRRRRDKDNRRKDELEYEVPLM